jgi:hypothetical protein
MRALALIGLLALASCGGGGEGENKAAPPAAPSPGQWELSAQVTRFTRADQGTPRINTPVGTRTSQSVCVGPGQLPTALFSGDDLTCSYTSYYVRNGMANATLSCQRHGLDGNIMVAADGSFGADRINLHRNVRTVLTTDGDVQIDSDVTGRRTGSCTPTAAPAEGQNRQ